MKREENMIRLGQFKSGNAWLIWVYLVYFRLRKKQLYIRPNLIFSFFKQLNEKKKLFLLSKFSFRYRSLETEVLMYSGRGLMGSQKIGSLGQWNQTDPD